MLPKMRRQPRGWRRKQDGERELLATIRDHYWCSSKKDKSRILDEFIAVTGYHRKHGIRLLGKSDDDEGTTRSVRDRHFHMWRAFHQEGAARRLTAAQTWPVVIHQPRSTNGNGHQTPTRSQRSEPAPTLRAEPRGGEHVVQLVLGSGRRASPRVIGRNLCGAPAHSRDRCSRSSTSGTASSASG